MNEEIKNEIRNKNEMRKKNEEIKDEGIETKVRKNMLFHGKNSGECPWVFDSSPEIRLSHQ